MTTIHKLAKLNPSASLASGIVLVTAFLLLLSGCSATLKPAPEARKVRLNGSGAVAEAAGVRIMAAASRWSGTPADLSNLATPLYLRIENRSHRALRIRYDQFEFVSRSGFKATAVAPYRIEGTIVQPVRLPQNYRRPRGFQLAPHYRTEHHDTHLPRHPWNYDEYTPNYNVWAFPLPTIDMLEKGIPEGVLEAGEQISGFLYFPKMPEDLRRIVLEAKIIDAQSGKSFGTVSIPFVMT